VAYVAAINLGSAQANITFELTGAQSDVSAETRHLTFPRPVE